MLARMAARQGRVAIIGGSGTGKSSVMASVLGPLAGLDPSAAMGGLSKRPDSVPTSAYLVTEALPGVIRNTVPKKTLSTYRIQ